MNYNCYPSLYKQKVVEYYTSSKNITVKQVLKIFCISNGTLFNWIKLYKNNQLKEKMKYQYITKITPVIKCYIRNYVLKRINFNYKLLLKLIKNKYKTSISKSSLYNIIHKFNITKKKIRKKKIYGKYSKLNKNIKLMKKQMHKIDVNNLISIDEVSFDTSIISDKGWAIKGEKIHKKVNAKRTRYTGICAVSNKKILELKIVKKSADASIFLDFLKKLNKTINLKNKYILLDNAGIHHAKIVKKYTNDNNINTIYNVAYHPEFNPIEHSFSKVKILLNYYKNNEHELIKNIRKAFNKIRKKDLKNYFKKSLETLFNFKKYIKKYEK